MRARTIRTSYLVLTGLFFASLCASRAQAFHTIFTFRADRFELDGNTSGPHDGTPDVVNEFDDGALLPEFYNAFGTALESGGYLVLTNPGFHAPSPLGGTIDLSVAASSSTRIFGGSGDATTTSYWDPTPPPLGQSYHFTFFVTVAVGGFQQIMGIGIANRAGTLEFEQHRADLNQSTFAYQNLVFDFMAISPGDITGQIGLRLDYDDSTQFVTGSVSLDGGATWASPFPARELSDMASDDAQLILSADPEPGSGGGTTTTTVSPSTTTSTTLVPGSCSAIGCRRTTKSLGSKLVIKDKATDKGDSFAWKFRRGDATDLADFGDPAGTTSYTFCLSDGTGAVLMQADVPPGATCNGSSCWKATSKGLKYTDPDKAQDGLRKIVLRPGVAGASQVLVKGRGENLTLPLLPLQNLPITARLSASNGECWANVFGSAGVGGNIPAQFTAKGD